MSIQALTLPYPDFKLHEIIEPDQFDLNNMRTVEKINEIKTILNQITDSIVEGGSGADTISLTPIAPFASTKLQSYLKEVITQLRSTTDASSGADFLGSTGIVGVTGLTVQSQLKSLKSLLDVERARITTNIDALTTHKSSADHDARYYTEGEVDNFLTSIKGSGYTNETLIGLKNLITSVQTQINNLNNTYSTDAERIQAINDVINQFTIADNNMNALINNKANKSDVYTKTEMDAQTFGATRILDRAITSLKIALNSIKSEHIENYSITANKFSPEILETAGNALMNQRVTTLETNQGDINVLSTVNKTLVGALNEVKSAIDGLQLVASNVTISDVGNYFNAPHTEGALQEIGQVLNAMRGNLITTTNSILGS